MPACVFSMLSFIVAVPSAIKVFNWLGTLHKGYIRFDAPMLYALGFIGLFTMGGLTGLFLAALAADVHLHDTYFVVAHFHYIMVGGMVSAYFGGSALLVAEDQRPDVSGDDRARSRAADVPRLQSDLLPAVHPGLSRHAAALSFLSAGVPAAERAVLGRRLDPRRGLSDAARLSELVAAPRQPRAGQSLARDWAWSGRRRRRRRPATSS